MLFTVLLSKYNIHVVFLPLCKNSVWKILKLLTIQLIYKHQTDTNSSKEN